MPDFHKYHALGNDYIVINPAESRFVLNEDNTRLVCHRNFGVGSDGILYGPLPDRDGIALRIFNPDGSEAEKSGNGLRIFSRYLHETGLSGGDSFAIDTPGGKVQVDVVDADPYLIRIEMGRVSFLGPEVPVAGVEGEVVHHPLLVDGEELLINCLTIGNPHCVVFGVDVNRELAERFGPLLETHPLFPNRINCQFVQVIDRSNIRIEIWERGAGYTLASGSSSCAAASAARRLDLVDEKVTVHMPGGDLLIEMGEGVLMTGPVTAVASGDFAPEMLGMLQG